MDLKPLVVKEARAISLETYSFRITKQANRLYQLTSQQTMDLTNNTDTKSLGKTNDITEGTDNKGNDSSTVTNSDSSALESGKQNSKDESLQHRADETELASIDPKDRQTDTKSGVPKPEKETGHFSKKTPNTYGRTDSSSSPQHVTTVQTSHSAQVSEGALISDRNDESKNQLVATAETEDSSVENIDGSACRDESKTLEAIKNSKDTEASDGNVDSEQKVKESVSSPSEPMEVDPANGDNSKRGTTPLITETESVKEADQDSKMIVDSESQLESTSSNGQTTVEQSATPQEPPPPKQSSTLQEPPPPAKHSNLEQVKPADVVPETTNIQVVASDTATGTPSTTKPSTNTKLVSEVIPVIDKSPPQTTLETSVEVFSSVSSLTNRQSNTLSTVSSSSVIPTGIASPVSVISSPRVAVTTQIPVLKGALKMPAATMARDQDKLTTMGAEKLKVGQAELLHASVDLLGQQKQIEIKSREEITGRAPPQVAVIPPMDFSKSHEVRFAANQQGQGVVKKKRGEKGGRDGALVIEKSVNIAHPVAHRG